MCKESIKLYKFGRGLTITGLVIFLLLLICSVVLMIIEYTVVACLIVCGILGLVCFAVFLYLFTRPFFVKLDSNNVIETNAFGKIKKSHELKSLKEIRIISGTSRSMCGDYICFIFSNKNCSDYSCDDLLKEDDVTIIEY